MNGLQGIMSCQSPLWAAFTDADGKPIIRRCHALGVMQTGMDKTETIAARHVTAFCALEAKVDQMGGFMPADYVEGFLGYTEDPDPLKFVDLAREVRKDINDKKAKQKIIVPDNEIVRGSKAVANVAGGRG